MRRVLHIMTTCGLAGTETVLRSLICGFSELGIASEAYFQRDLGGIEAFRALCLTHIESEQALAEVIAHGSFDAIHAVSSTVTMGVSRAVAATGFAGPVLVSCHGDYIAGWHRGNANRIIALTESWGTAIGSHTDVPVTVVGNPVDVARFCPPATGSPGSPKRIVAWVGRSAEACKNFRRLKEIIAALPGDQYEFHVADGDAGGDRSLVFGTLAERVGFYGRLPHAEMPRFYQEAAASGGVLLSTSDREGFAMSILEAMACGCPVVVPDAMGTSEVIADGRGGRVYERSRSPESAVARIHELSDPQLWQQAAHDARAAAVARFSLPVIARRYLDELEAAAATPRDASLRQRLAWAGRSCRYHLHHLPLGVSLYRVRCGADAFERALHAYRIGDQGSARRELLKALFAYPPVYTKPWRVKFLLRSLLPPRDGAGRKG